MTTHKSKTIRVRIAPSPTGNLHIGTARSALFNWMFAKHTGGDFIVRIEDTDKERSTKEFEKDILDGLAWLGLDYDEGPLSGGGHKGAFGPYRQSERLNIYEKYLHQLLNEHKAYYCFCTKEELEAQRQSQESGGQAPKYSGKCRSISVAESQARLAGGETAVIRLKVAPEKIKFHDEIRGQLEFDNALSGDIVIAKNLREPLYNFSVVIDDYEMQISHVIRGEDHIANTPKQIAIAEALGLPKLLYAHLPLILNADRSKMSKRFNATNVAQYRADGYLPKACRNFLALLGWHPAADREVLSMDEIVKEFELSRVQKGGAIFNVEKLNFFNSHYIKELSAQELSALLSQDDFSEPAWRTNTELFQRVVALAKERLVKLSDFKAAAESFFNLPEYDAKMLVWKKGTPEAAKENLQRVRDVLAELPEQLVTKINVEPKIAALAEHHGKGDVFWPLRVAVSGRETSPPPVDIIDALGKHESLARIDIAIKKLS